MLTVSKFFGIIILMFWDDHNPPHYYAKCGKYLVMVEIKTGVIKGRFPPKALRHLLEWHDLHKPELMANWQRAKKGLVLNDIEGLK